MDVIVVYDMLQASVIYGVFTTDRRADACIEHLDRDGVFAEKKNLTVNAHPTYEHDFEVDDDAV